MTNLIQNASVLCNCDCSKHHRIDTKCSFMQFDKIKKYRVFMQTQVFSQSLRLGNTIPKIR